MAANRNYFFALVILLSLSGCKTVSTQNVSRGSQKEMQDAIGVMAEALGGQEMTEEQVDALVHQLRTDEEAQEAVQLIADSYDSQKVRVKFCPIDGERFASHLVQCPEHLVTLEFVE